jgi:hypothetical protein
LSPTLAPAEPDRPSNNVIATAAAAPADFLIAFLLPDRVLHSGELSAKPVRLSCAYDACRLRVTSHSRLMPDSRKIVRHSLEVLAIVAPLAGMTYFLFNPDAFNAFLDWLLRVL